MEPIGQTLREARESKGITMQEVHQALHIQGAQIEAMEADEFDKLPAPAYARAFLRHYAAYLGLDPEPLVEAYNASAGKEPPSINVGWSAAPPTESRWSAGTLPVIAAGTLAVLLLSGAYVVHLFLAGKAEVNRALQIRPPARVAVPSSAPARPAGAPANRPVTAVPAPPAPAPAGTQPGMGTAAPAPPAATGSAAAPASGAAAPTAAATERAPAVPPASVAPPAPGASASGEIPEAPASAAGEAPAPRTTAAGAAPAKSGAANAGSVVAAPKVKRRAVAKRGRQRSVVAPRTRRAAKPVRMPTATKPGTDGTTPAKVVPTVPGSRLAPTQDALLPPEETNAAAGAAESH